MNQQQQDKAAFFAQYIGSQLGGRKSFTDSQELTLSNFSSVVRYSSAPLLLKPLSAITDEDAAGMLSAICPTLIEKLDREDFNVREYADQMVAGFESERPIPGASFSDCVCAIDFLRSKGYLIPFRNYSTDQILEIGWAKLREP